MEVFIVTVQTPIDGRYIDSLWVSIIKADDRVNDLREEFKRTGKKVDVSSWWAWRSRARVMDAELKIRKQSAKSAAKGN